MTPRWSATVTYLADGGPIEVPHEFEELDELHNLIEFGPDWNCIEKIEIRLSNVAGRLTLEQAERQ